MKSLLKLRRSLQKFYNKNAVWVQAVLKFLLALTVFQMIQMQIGSAQTIRSVMITVVLAVVSAFLSTNVIAVFAGILFMYHLSSLSPEALGVGGAVILIVGLVYFGTGPKESYALLLTPVTLALHIPCLMPVILGLVEGPSAAWGIAAGTILYYTMQILTGSAYMTIPGEGMDEILSHIMGVLNEIVRANDIILMTIILLLVFAVVSMIRRMSVDYAWYLAIGTGVFSYILLEVIAIVAMNSQESLIGTFLSAVVTVFAAMAVQIFVFSVDYRRTERIQFEDDDFYYYVKAVPKIGRKKRKAEIPAQMESQPYQQRWEQPKNVTQTADGWQKEMQRRNPNEEEALQEQMRKQQEQYFRDASRYAASTQEDIKERERQEWLRRRTEQGGSRYDKRKGG